LNCGVLIKEGSLTHMARENKCMKIYGSYAYSVCEPPGNQLRVALLEIHEHHLFITTANCV
jgi:hypothetical protein